MDTKVLEGNKLIAEFMGGKFIKSDPMYYSGLRSFYYFKDKPNIPYSDMRYHTSWDWLKPVIDEIFLFGLVHANEVDKIRKMSIVVDITPAWQKVVDFIKWYNQNKTHETN